VLDAGLMGYSPPSEIRKFSEIVSFRYLEDLKPPDAQDNVPR